MGITKKQILFSLCALSTLAACNSQQFNVPSENQEFGQKVVYSKDVDVLWVIDTSGSMTPRQEKLAAQVGLFVDALETTGLNYQMGVTTMDMSRTGQKGDLVAQPGTSVVLKKGTPDIAKILADRLVLGAEGSPVERGQEAMKTALESALSPIGNNAGFLRENSLLNIIFLSDEEDTSVDADYIKFLDQIRPPLPSGDRSWIAHYIGILPDDPDCKTSDWGYSSVGTKYMNLARVSGGAQESICKSNFRAALTNVKARVLEVTTEYPLDRKPNVASIKVYVDNSLVPMQEVDGWSYIANKNSIRFHGAAIPKAGSSIKVKFDPAELK